jgi:hypothetical protein
MEGDPKSLTELKPETLAQRELVDLASMLGDFARYTIETSGEQFEAAAFVLRTAGPPIADLPFPITVIAESKDGKKEVLAISVCELFAPKYTDLKPHALKALFRRLDAECYALASEAWMLELPVSKEQPVEAQLEEPELAVPVREDDRRISVLLLNGETTAGDQLFGTWRITEEAERKLDLANARALEFFNKQNDDARIRLGGRLTGLLD